MFILGIYLISIFKIMPEPDLAGITSSNPSETGAGTGFGTKLLDLHNHWFARI